MNGEQIGRELCGTTVKSDGLHYLILRTNAETGQIDTENARLCPMSGGPEILVPWEALWSYVETGSWVAHMLARLDQILAGLS